MSETRHPSIQRLSRDAYYMGIAIAVRERASCLGTRVGAVLVLDDRVISTGYNGTPMNMKNCDEGGCERCANRERSYPSGEAYDFCICVHAEQNALLTAARFGIPVQGTTLYTTKQPCFGCTKELIQAGIQRVYYLHDWKPKAGQERQYELLQNRIPEGIRQLALVDPRVEWAEGGRTLMPRDSDPASDEAEP